MTTNLQTVTKNHLPGSMLHFNSFVSYDSLEETTQSINISETYSVAD